MNDFQDRDSVHQVVFRWDGNHGRQGTGMNAVAHSCEAGRAEELGRELGPLLWVSGAAAARPSVVRTLSRDGDVLLVQRWPTTDRGGRPSTVSHVLVGDRGTLPPARCLGLAYGGWRKQERAEQESGRLTKFDLTDLHDLSRGRLPGMVERLPEIERALILAGAELLRDPRQRVSLLLEEKTPERWPDPAMVPLAYLGLFLIFGSWLDTEWTFATYDTVDSHPLRLMSVPHWEPDAGGSGPLARVVGRRPATVQFEHRAAAQLVAHLLAHPQAAPGVPQLVKELPDGAALNWERRRDRLRKILGPDRQERGRSRERAGEREQERDRAQERDRPRELDLAGQPAGPTITTDPYPEAPYQEASYAEAPYPETYTEPYREAPYADPYGQPYPPPSPAPPQPPHTPAPAPAPAPSPNGHDPHDAHALHLKLCGYRRGDGDGSRRSYLMAELRMQSDELLLHELRSSDLPAESVELVLDELGGPGRVEDRDPQTRHELCAEVLRKRLYFKPEEPSPEDTSKTALAIRAAHLFTWAVAPVARDPRHFAQLSKVLNLMSQSTDVAASTWLQRSIIRPDSDQIPDLPPELWRQLLLNALNRDGRQPAAPQPPRPVQAPTASPPQRTDVASDPGGIPDRLFIGSLLVLGAVLVVLVLMLIA
ncbi:hypothetical protein [Streptomyces sp. NPDC093591]|uniref:hypothetical protein n=1 Tax=Streptomyces sp. NPDC093591 TaxID=3366044 RepID=UPI0037F87552